MTNKTSLGGGAHPGHPGGHPGGHPAAAGAAEGRPPAVDFSHCPFLVIWETTRSCGLACRHCRADAILGRDANELSTDEGKQLLDQVADMGTPIVILSGGDPMNRPDLEELVAHAKGRGLRVGTIPAATESVTRERIVGLAEAGLDQIAFSLDAPTADLHDGFRGTPGAYEITQTAVGWAHEASLPVQINTCFAAWNLAYLEEMVEKVSSLGVVFWEVFFLVQTGRAQAMQGINAEQFEDIFDRLYRLNSEVDFIIKLTEAPHYRRFVTQREEDRERVRHIVARPRGVAGSIGMSPEAVNSGKGFLFVDHLGEICPSGFLPLSGGNVRSDAIAEVYRNSRLFHELRDSTLLKGKCGQCEFRRMCSGSRARAWAVTGDYLASDPGCSYVPTIKEPDTTGDSLHVGQ